MLSYERPSTSESGSEDGMKRADSAGGVRRLESKGVDTAQELDG
jgi:hypothetical protein